MDGHLQSPGFYLALGFQLATPVTTKEWPGDRILAQRKLIWHLK